MKNKKEAQLEAGDKVFIIGRNLEIEEKKVYGVVFEEETIKYQLEEHQCGGTEKTQIFKTKAKAEAKKQDFLDELKFKVGELVVFEYKEYSNSTPMKSIGRVWEINFSTHPYLIKDSYSHNDTVTEEQILLKLKNDFIEGYGNIQGLYKEFNEKEKELRDIIKRIHNQHDSLEKELNLNIRKQYGLFNWNKSRPLFSDRFSYEDNHDY